MDGKPKRTVAEQKALEEQQLATAGIVGEKRIAYDAEQKRLAEEAQAQLVEESKKRRA